MKKRRQRAGEDNACRTTENDTVRTLRKVYGEPTDIRSAVVLYCDAATTESNVLFHLSVEVHWKAQERPRRRSSTETHPASIQSNLGSMAHFPRPHDLRPGLRTDSFLILTMLLDDYNDQKMWWPRFAVYGTRRWVVFHSSLLMDTALGHVDLGLIRTPIARQVLVL